jgi:exopolysaccharide production protein ExoZ
VAFSRWKVMLFNFRDMQLPPLVSRLLDLSTKAGISTKDFLCGPLPPAPARRNFNAGLQELSREAMLRHHYRGQRNQIPELDPPKMAIQKAVPQTQVLPGNSRTKQPSAYFPAIDILRFFAAAMVALFHIAFLSWASKDSPIYLPFQSLTSYSWFGWVGVEIFFVISGLVIANSANGQSPSHFINSRILRLYPAVWICATMSLAVLLLESQHHLWKPYVLSLALFPAGPKIDTVYWTLKLEMLFYGLIFLLLAAGKFQRLSVLAWALTIPGSAVTALHFTGTHDFAVDPSGLYFTGNMWRSFLLARYGCFFAAGIWIWLIVSGRGGISSFCGLAGTAISGVSAIADRSQALMGNIHCAISLPALVPCLIWLLSLAVIFLTMRPDRQLTLNPRLARVSRRLGLMTYPMYLLHKVVGIFLVTWLIRVGLLPWWSLVATFCAILSLSWAVCTIFEPAIRRELKNAIVYVETPLRKCWNRSSYFIPREVNLIELK